ncbi:DNA-3-methyladenine glycosylase II [Faunimonas pinastri]|uniref:DNA-3-methyladenine glycosylase II n=1 Tax=Faunimonas pinastri TaxID=1855383 RepID=A0A1H9G0G0_9HYPH|nr:DNA-3-methyladenine glycosylase [Faunimonas pinastri]SEQ43549.1 DNA-3-methyladenine glycosylase II [Faunimonas pinastri]
MRRIDTEADIAEAVAALAELDPRLAAVLGVAGSVPLRRRAGGFEGLARTIMGQQISDAAADAIWTRFRAAVEPFTPAQYLATPVETLQTAGLSAAKIRTLTGIATALTEHLDLDALHLVPAQEAIAAMTALKGIGPWTAEVYLLFSAGHPDIFPAGDLALQEAVRDAFGLEARPSEKALREMAALWSPWRGVAARLFWAYYRVRKNLKSEFLQ